MSWYTSVNLQYLSDEKFEISECISGISAAVEKMSLSKDVVTDLKKLIENGEAAFNLHWPAVIELFEEIAKLSPSVDFAVRGRGEEFRCIWVREYENGKQAFSFGPPEDVE